MILKNIGSQIMIFSKNNSVFLGKEKKNNLLLNITMTAEEDHWIQKQCRCKLQ